VALNYFLPIEHTVPIVFTYKKFFNFRRNGCNSVDGGCHIKTQGNISFFSMLVGLCAHRARKKNCGIHRKENAQKMKSLDHKNSQHIDAEVLYQHEIYIPIDKNVVFEHF